MNHPDDFPTFNPLDHFNPPEDEEAVMELAKIAYRNTLLGDLKGNEDWPGPVAVEIGSWAGRTTLSLARSCLFRRVFAVDHWHGNPDDRLGEVAQKIGWQRAFQTFCHNMGPLLMQRVFPLFGSSMHWSSVWPASLPIDLLYVDGNHRYEHVRYDILAWSEHVRPGGIIAGHDYGLFEGVNRAVQETGAFDRKGATVWWRRKE